jgi:diguanylate cyclase (GGDEF)-like protein
MGWREPPGPGPHGEDPSPAGPETGSANHGRRVLLVEDDAFLRRLLRVTLRRAGWDVVEARDGVRAWEILRRQHVPMVLTDVMMPGMDGLDLIRRIRQADWPAYTYVVVLTVLNGTEHVVAGMNAGADDYLSKPFHRDVLLARLAAGARVVDQDARLRRSLAHETERSSRDELTGLLTRRAALERMSAEMARLAREGGRISLILADVDHFKALNDECGHAAGDEALRLVGRLLRRELRDYDIAARWGGDEFLVALPATAEAQALAVAERIRACLETAPVASGDGPAARLRASLGVSSARLDGKFSLKGLLRQADEALYRSKADGRNRVTHFEAPAREAGEAAAAAAP